MRKLPTNNLTNFVQLTIIIIRIIESLRLEKTIKIIESNHNLTILP